MSTILHFKDILHRFLLTFVNSTAGQNTRTIHQTLGRVSDCEDLERLQSGRERVAVERHPDIHLAGRELTAVRRDAGDLGLGDVNPLNVDVVLLAGEANDNVGGVDEVDPGDFDGRLAGYGAQLGVHVHDGVGGTDNGSHVEHVHIVEPLVGPPAEDYEFGPLEIVGEDGV